jgi:hypothetical protein
MTEVEELIQEVNDEPPTIVGAILLLDKCNVDLKRLMETEQIGRCNHTRNLVYGLSDARDMLAQLQHKINEAHKTLEQTKNGN